MPIIGQSPLLSRRWRTSDATTPSWYNLAEFARGVKYEDCRCLVVGDSINTLETSASTMTHGYRDSWRPKAWKGYAGNSSQNLLNYTSVASAINSVVGPEANSTSYYDTNRWSMVSGTRALETTGSSPDVASAKVTGLSATNFSPNAYREIVFKGTANGDAAGTGNVPNGVAIWGFAHNHLVWQRFNSYDQSSETANIQGDWSCGGDAITCRLIYFQNANGPTSLVWSPTRATVSAGSNVTISASGTEAVGYTDCIVNASSGPSSTSTRIVARIIATGAGGTGSSDDESNKVLPLIGFRVFRHTLATGLELSFWSNSGWNSSHFASTSLVANSHLDLWLDAHGWPNHVLFQVGQNQTSAETSELDGGTITEYKYNMVAIIARLRSRYAANSKPNPRMCFVSPYDTSRSSANYTAMANALYSIAQEYGAGFINLPKMTVAARCIDSTDVTSVLTRDNVHPSATGAQYFQSLIWRCFENSLNE